jgi:hypothetical protein
MPTYSYQCECGEKQTLVIQMSKHRNWQPCKCGKRAEQIITSAPMAIIAKDICYDSPIDGRPITSMAQRKEDLARAGCVEYDPCMRQDYDRRLKREEAALDKAVDETVDTAIAQMPARKRETLESEMAAGFTAEIERKTVAAQ